MENKCGYGDSVTFSNRGVNVNALVIQSALVNIADSTQPNGIRTEEHLSLLYLKPELGQYQMGSSQVDMAIGKVFGVLLFDEWPEKEPNYPFAVLVSAAPVYELIGGMTVPENPKPELIQNSPVHKVHMSPARTVAREAKQIEAPTQYGPDGGQYTPPEWETWSPEAKAEYLQAHPEHAPAQQEQPTVA